MNVLYTRNIHVPFSVFFSTFNFDNGIVYIYERESVQHATPSSALYIPFLFI